MMFKRLKQRISNLAHENESLREDLNELKDEFRTHCEKKRENEEFYVSGLVHTAITKQIGAIKGIDFKKVMTIVGRVNILEGQVKGIATAVFPKGNLSFRGKIKRYKK